jgi:hypothetical protein
MVLSLGVATLISFVGFLLHNIREFRIAGLLAPDTATVPVVVIQLSLYVIWWRLPSLRTPAFLALLVFGLLHLIGGAILSVLPLEVLPFIPEQSLTHYFSHILYGVAQVPLICVTTKGLVGK